MSDEWNPFKGGFVIEVWPSGIGASKSENRVLLFVRSSHGQERILQDKNLQEHIQKSGHTVLCDHVTIELPKGYHEPGKLPISYQEAIATLLLGTFKLNGYRFEVGESNW